MALKFIDSADIAGKKVLARFDFNVPLKDGVIQDSSRIDLALPTIEYLIKQGAGKIVLMSHLGRPKGKFEQDLSLEPVAHYLAEKLNSEVILSESCTDSGISTLLNLNTTKIILLENLRFHPEEKSDDRAFAEILSKYGDIYVNDAFGAAHRKHASVHQINAFFKNKAYGGFLIKQELEALNKIIESPKKPFVSIIGGAKVADKIVTIEKLLVLVDQLLIGGAMAYPFLKAQGYRVGKSLAQEADVRLASSILKRDKGNKIVLPIDHVVAKSIDSNTPMQTEGANIDEDYMGLDIGEQTIALFKSKLHNAKTVFWNGPMGLFENMTYAKGTFSLAQVLSELKDSFTLVGGGDSVNAIKKSGLADSISHISSGGGASLEYIEKGTLPGIQALRFGLE